MYSRGKNIDFLRKTLCYHVTTRGGRTIIVYFCQSLKIVHLLTSNSFNEIFLSMERNCFLFEAISRVCSAMAIIPNYCVVRYDITNMANKKTYMNISFSMTNGTSFRQLGTLLVLDRNFSFSAHT